MAKVWGGAVSGWPSTGTLHSSPYILGSLKLARFLILCSHNRDYIEVEKPRCHRFEFANLRPERLKSYETSGNERSGT